MKTNRIKLTLVVAAVAAAFNLNLKAAAPFLSPRAQANQIRTVPGVTENKLTNRFLHRSDSIFHTSVKVLSGDRNLVREAREVTVSPRAAETFPWLVNRSVCRCDMAASAGTGPTRS
jgi:hypothetical protein